MKYKIIFSYLLFYLFVLSSSSLFSQNILFQKSLVKYAYSNNPDWSRKDFDDSNWNIMFDTFIPYKSDQLWIRTKFYSSVSDTTLTEYQLYLTMIGTYEVYWNGKFLGTNCIEGSEINQKNGQFSKTFDLSGSKILKENLLAIKILVDEDEDVEIADMLIESKRTTHEGDIYKYGYLFSLLILHVFFLFLFIINPLNFNKFQVFYFSLLLLSIVLNITYEMVLFFGIISYRHNFIINIIESYQNLFFLLSITIFYFSEYNVKRKTIFILAHLVLIVFLKYTEVSEAYLYFWGLFPSIVLMVFASIKKQVGALYSLIFLLIIFSITYAWFVFQLIHISFFIFPTFFIIRKIRLDAEQVKQLHQTELRSARLETEMLKKILQPHYIMNSLNAVLEWIEERPKQGLDFIKELSDEFRLFLKLSNKKFVTVREELNLCKKHLKIMEFRHHKKYIMQINIESLNRIIPPAIFHTIIENGITHKPSNSNSICFIFEEHINSNSTNFRITTNYSGNCSLLDFDTEVIIKNNFLHSQKIIEGNGYKYIRSRLKESYKNNWELTYFGDDLFWVTNITIYN